jgi:hypothetical protein
MDLQQIATWSKAKFVSASDSAYQGQFVTNVHAKMDHVCGALIELSRGLYELCAAFEELGKRLPARQVDLQPIAVRSRKKLQDALDCAANARSISDLNVKISRFCSALMDLSAGLYELCAAFEEIGKCVPARRHAETTL